MYMYMYMTCGGGSERNQPTRSRHLIRQALKDNFNW